MTGLNLRVEGETLQICGVFERDEPILIRPGSGGYTAAELPDLPAGADAYRYADGFFWSGLFRSLSARFSDWLDLCPAGPDIPVKLAWLKLLGSVAAALWVCPAPAGNKIRRPG